MSTKTGSSLSGKKASPAMIAVAVVILAILIGAYGYKTLTAPANPVPPMSADAQSKHDWILEKAKATGGDYSKLSQADQQKLQQMTNGMGPLALKGMWNQNQ